MGVNFIYQPMTADTLGDEKVWVKLLAITQDPASRPVLVHCAQGELRTGFFCALYRQIIDGWSWEKAIAEMERFGYDLKSHQTAVALLKQIDIQGARAALQKACSQPAKQP
jgi:protein tyrosine/serine phosphatase